MFRHVRLSRALRNSRSVVWRRLSQTLALVFPDALSGASSRTSLLIKGKIKANQSSVVCVKRRRKFHRLNLSRNTPANVSETMKTLNISLRPRVLLVS